MPKYRALYVTHRGMPRYLVHQLFGKDGAPTLDPDLATHATVALADGNFQVWEICSENIEREYYH